jgi:hypothetical protein
MSEPETFDWSPLGEGFWTETAATCGATDRQARFACLRHRGMTAAGAAREAGYTGDNDSIRQAGSRAAKSTAVMNMLAMAAAEAGGGNDGTVTRTEAKHILSRLARGSDPNVRIKAIESLNKIDTDERNKPEPERSPQDILREISSVSLDLAVQLAEDNNIVWDPPELTAAQRAEAEERRLGVARDWIMGHPDQARQLLAMLPRANGGSQEAPSNVVSIDGPPDFPDNNDAA